jgi:hypothetical protein
MSDPTAYESGARKPVAKTGPDPNDDFSQAAAGNRKPPLGIGLTEKTGAAQPRPPGKAPAKRPKTPPPPTPPPGHASPPPRDVREAPAENPNGDPAENRTGAPDKR